jgi:hypothetical protein
MSKFTINPYYLVKPTISIDEIERGIQIAINFISLKHKPPFLIGEGNDAKGKVYTLEGTKFCLKISELSKFVGRNQEKQFDINLKGMECLNGKSVEIEGEKYELQIIPVIAVYVDENQAYTLMIWHDNTVRLWDEENIPFKDKDNWDIIREIKGYIRDFGGEVFIEEMDINGNNLLVDLQNKAIYVIDAYVP